MTTQPPLLSAEMIEASLPKPPKRDDWYQVLYVTKQGRWTWLCPGRSGKARATEYTTLEAAHTAAMTLDLPHARIVRIPGE